MAPMSGLSGLELERSLTQLRKLRKTLIFEEVSESDPTPTDTLSDKLDKVIALLESRTHDPLVSDQLNVTRGGLLIPQGEDELRSAIESTRNCGSDKLHLAFLSNTYTNANETSSRMLIDTPFFRTAAMVPPDQRMVVMLETPVPTVRPKESKAETVSGVMDYTCLVADADLTLMHLRKPLHITSRIGKNTAAFFTSEAKACNTSSNGDSTPLEKHRPQALLELVARAKHFGKSHIRGALTTGYQWVFLAVDLHDDDEGATYWESDMIQWSPERVSGTLEATVPVTSDDPATIAGILSSWVPNSFSKFDGDGF
ncbi:hypothetical protein FA13DRAFT_1763439, partial [Coprinellus micaceus]